MELTPEFTKCVRRARERHLGSASAPADRIVRKRKEKSPVHTAADQIVSHLARLSDSVATCRPAYLNFRGLGSHAAMRDDERDAFDEEVRLTLKEVDRGIANLKQVAPSIGGAHGADCGRHFETLVELLELKRQSLSADTQDMQMTRSKHRAEGRHGFSLLRPDDAQKMSRMRRPPTSAHAPTATQAGSAAVGTSGSASDGGDAELEAENAALAQELVQRSGQRQHDITALHQQMSEIASQNQRLAHMLHDQNEVIDTLHADAEEIEDNVDAGNKELQQAVSRDSSNFRNLVVGLLLGASACLLFLDYYA